MSFTRTRLTGLLLAVAMVASACWTKERQQVTTQVPPPPAAAPTPAPRPTTSAPRTPAATLTNDVHWFRNSAEQYAVFLTTFRVAGDQLDEMTRGRARGSWAISIDADETLIDNSTYQKERHALGLGFTPESWTEWCKRREATATPGSVEFLQRVRAMGGIIFVVTNRMVEEQADTEANLRALGMPFDVMLTRQGSPDGRKDRRWRAIEDGTASSRYGPLPIVMYLGDNIEDFPNMHQDARTRGDAGFADFGVKYFAFPNPMYGSFMRNAME